MINLIELSYFQDYLYSPQNWCHHLNAIYKITFIFCYLAIVPFCPIFVIIIVAAIFSSILFNIGIELTSMPIISKKIFISIFLLFILLMFPYSISLDRILIIRCQLVISSYSTNAEVYRNMKFSCINPTERFQNYSRFIINIIMPISIIRIGIVVFSYLNLYRLIILTTSNNNIFLFYFQIVSHLQKYYPILFNLLFIIMLSNDFVKRLELKVTHTMIAISLRGLSSSSLDYYSKILYLYSISFNLFIKDITQDTMTMSKVAYLRDIIPRLRCKWLVT
uniref:Uncharacterized protein n=1 Tax=Balbiania investiens TaxID=111861 RepID=A0A4D6BL58_9FLOR|nr:hypothetical protein [Balbiania investiens]QBX88672.1 hypothetical protein [Balbiania investiens]